MNGFQCNEKKALCEKKARWLVWYKGCGGLYAYLCNEHTYKHMKNTNTPYPVVCVRSIEDAIGKVLVDNSELD